MIEEGGSKGEGGGWKVDGGCEASSFFPFLAFPSLGCFYAAGGQVGHAHTYCK
jgi:hypothetical protein